MLWICKACQTPYAVDAPGCPQCGAEEHGTDHEMPFGGTDGPELVQLEPGEEVKPVKTGE